MNIGIDKKLNLVIPLDRDNGMLIHIHSTPISPEAFEQHFEIIARVWAEIVNNDYGPASAPRIAGKLMKKIAVSEGVWDGPMGVEAMVMNEIRRLTVVIMPRGHVPPTMLLPDAVTKGIINKVEQDIVENALVFFTCVSSMQHGRKRKSWLDAMCALWAARLTSSGSTDFAASLPMLSETDNSGVKATG